MDAAVPLLRRHPRRGNAVLAIGAVILFCFSIYCSIHTQSVEAAPDDADSGSFSSLQISENGFLPFLPDAFKLPIRKGRNLGRRAQKLFSRTGVSGYGGNVAAKLYAKWRDSRRVAVLIEPEVFANDLLEIFTELEVPQKMRNHPRALWNFVHDVAFVLGEDYVKQKQLRVTGPMAKFVGILYWWALRSEADSSTTEPQTADAPREKSEHIIELANVLNDPGLSCYQSVSIGAGSRLTTLFYKIVGCGFSETDGGQEKGNLRRITDTAENILSNADSWMREGHRYENIRSGKDTYTEAEGSPGVGKALKAYWKTLPVTGHRMAYRTHIWKELRLWLDSVKKTVAEKQDEVLDQCTWQSRESLRATRVRELEMEVERLQQQTTCNSSEEKTPLRWTK